VFALWLSGALFLYNVVELVRAVGPEKAKRLFFGARDTSQRRSGSIDDQAATKRVVRIAAPLQRILTNHARYCVRFCPASQQLDEC